MTDPLPPCPPAVDRDSLPESSSPDLMIVPGTAAEHEQTWLLNGNEWKGPLDMNQYLHRERILLKQDLTRNNGMMSWILTSSTLPPNEDGTRPILAACETILKPAYVARDGSIEKIRAHGIGSVYTRPEHRGKGYASRMMTELSKRLETFQQPEGDKGSFSVLFSDIGPKFYARHGWKPFASTHIHLAPLNAEQYAISRAPLPAVRDLRKDELNKLPTAEYFEEILETVSKQNSNVPCVAIRPDVQHFDWHHSREEVVTTPLNLPFPLVKGAIHEDTGIAIIWNRVFASDPKEWSLHVLHVVIPPKWQTGPTEESTDALAALLLRAQYEAFAWNMADGVEVWDPPELIVSAAQSLRTVEQGQVEIIHRDEFHICSLHWMGSRAGDDTTKDVIWVNAEKYAWC